ncbi:unnamed protein product [Mesocestoides corti]|uniref:Secreted protein n=1 Tax=Mesocestoides corti TaxID=53468 RepID=A0A0R3UKT3_MESCO|nr:unnamed protein product [Mesocestoides corti]
MQETSALSITSTYFSAYRPIALTSAENSCQGERYDSTKAPPRYIGDVVAQRNDTAESCNDGAFCTKRDSRETTAYPISAFCKPLW